MSLEKTLNDRGLTYGSFEENSEVAQDLKAVLSEWTVGHKPYMREALGMICSKLSRIACGDPMYIDSWRDISGFANRVVEILERTPGATDAKVERVTIE